MNHFQTGSVQNVTLVSIEILQLEFKINQTCAGHSRGSFARNIWSVHCRNTEVEFQTNPMPYLKYRENAGRKIWNWVLWQIQLNGELEMLQRSRGSSFEVHSTAEIWFAQSWQIWNVNQPRNPMAKLSTESVARRPPASEEGGMVALSWLSPNFIVEQKHLYQCKGKDEWPNFPFLGDTFYSKNGRAISSSVVCMTWSGAL